jgi:hypothetical protein
MERVLVLSADHYSIPDAKTGVEEQLFQVWYVSDYREASDTELGSKPIKILIKPELFAGLGKHELPAVFDIATRSRPGKAGVASMTIVDFKYAFTPELFKAGLPAMPVAKAA